MLPVKRRRGQNTSVDEFSPGGYTTIAAEIKLVHKVSPYRPRAFDRSVKKNMPGKLFFVFEKEGVLLVRTYVLCTWRRRNISLIEDLVR
jgi:hypothetical protein